MHCKLALVSATLLAAGMSSPATAQDRPYTEANVPNVSYIRIKPGMFDKYVKYLDGDYKKIMESAKKDGVIVDYGLYTTPEQHDGDYNMVLVVKVEYRSAPPTLPFRVSLTKTRAVWIRLRPFESGRRATSDRRTTGAEQP